MKIRVVVALFAYLVPVPLLAQHGGGRPAPPAHVPAREASQFDFLIGQWELVVRPEASGLAARLHGALRLVGTWKAWRAFDGFGIEDELRVVDGSGNPLSLTHALRVFDPATGRWSQTSLDVYRSVFTTSAAEWRDGEMWISGRGTDQEGRPYLARTRYYAIKPDAFSFRQDRSFDDGRTWKDGVLRIEAKRVAAAATR
jgi:hypothetical protein